ncbi:hypothetical protein HPB51_016454 [Rhipicephalus microplus]|uniref:Uncharacterized protein n=1 Tax=Rhipicephalus microplus TaxID=6941 RepID=A0A9J6DVA4_RHIMP|nr:hypothetical protein HPB51_016454 [Rhipicephalus microplus]
MGGDAGLLQRGGSWDSLEHACEHSTAAAAAASGGNVAQHRAALFPRRPLRGQGCRLLAGRAPPCRSGGLAAASKSSSVEIPALSPCMHVQLRSVTGGGCDAASQKTPRARSLQARARVVQVSTREAVTQSPRCVQRGNRRLLRVDSDHAYLVPHIKRCCQCLLGLRSKTGTSIKPAKEEMARGSVVGGGGIHHCREMTS